MSFVRCKRCLMPTSRPSTHFVDGICSACLNYDKRKTIDWQSRQEAFYRIIENLPKNDSGYQVIVASSGGKDSHSQVMQMLQMGVRPLVVTAATCCLTDMGRKNIDNLSRYATTIEYRPNTKVRAILNKLGLQLVGDISLPEHMIIFSAPFRAAVEFGIPTIIYGESPQFEYGGPPDSELASTMTRRWTMEHGGFLGMRPMDFVGMNGITEDDMKDYMLPSAEKMKDVTAYFLGQYFPWDSRANAKIAIGMGMEYALPCKANWWEWENLDNGQTGLHDYFGWLKYGYGRGCAQVSIDIRHGHISRETAYEFVRRLDGEFPYEYAGVYFDRVLSEIDVSQKEFYKLVSKFTNKDIFSSDEIVDMLKYRFDNNSGVVSYEA